MRVRGAGQIPCYGGGGEEKQILGGKVSHGSALVSCSVDAMTEKI